MKLNLQSSCIYLHAHFMCAPTEKNPIQELYNFVYVCRGSEGVRVREFACYIVPLDRKWRRYFIRLISRQFAFSF